jgi:tetratricopeptide (TPR) repeat protein
MAATCGRVGALVLLACGLVPAARADDKPDALRAELLRLNAATTEEGQAARLRALLKDRAKAKQAVAEAARMMNEAKDGDKPFNFNAAGILARAAHLVRDYAAAEPFYEHQIALATALDSGPKLVAAYEGVVALYFDARRYGDVIDTCQKALEATGPKELAENAGFFLEQLIRAKAKQGKFDEALKMTRELLEAESLAWYFLQLQGWVLWEAGKLDEAAASYTEALDKIDARKDLPADRRDRVKDEVRYVLSGVYTDAKDLEKAAKQLQILIRRNPDVAAYKNDLGFLWADRGLNLEEAEKLIREALDLDRKSKQKLKDEGKLDDVTENAAYLDSMGWVLFKQKKYMEALPFLKQAAADEDDGNHLEIWDHLADCYLALGERKEAVAAWEKALKMEDLSKLDAERRRKVTEKLTRARAEVAKP